MWIDPMTNISAFSGTDASWMIARLFGTDSNTASSSSGTTATQPASASLSNASATSLTTTSINQIFAILKAANDQAGSLSSHKNAVAAYAAEAISTAAGSIGVSIGIGTTSKSTIEQMEAAVSQVNSFLNESPVNTTGKQVTINDAYVVSVGSAPVSTNLDLPGGLPKPTTIAEALQQLSQSGNAGVAAAAKSLAARWVPGDSIDNGGWAGTPAEIADMQAQDYGSVGGTVAFMLHDYRDELVQGLAYQMVTTSPKASSHTVGLLSATYNGSFTLVDTGSKALLQFVPALNNDESDTVSSLDNTVTNWGIVV